MSGPWAHPKSGVFYFRKATPPDLVAARGRLAEIDSGIKVTREVHRSLGTRDRRAAERSYKQVSESVEAEWDRWRLLLENGPISLSHKNLVALAGSDAAAFLRENEHNPQLVRAPTPWVRSIFTSMRKALGPGVLPSESRMRLYQLEADLTPRSLPDLVGRLHELLPLEPTGPARDALQTLVWALDARRRMHSENRAKKSLAARGLSVDPSSRVALAERVDVYMAKAIDKLREYLAGDYRPPAWLEGIPEFERPGPTPGAIPTVLSLDYLLDHKAKTGSIRPKTVVDNRAYLKKFGDFVGHDDARRITKDDVRRWRDSLMETGLAPKTITDRYLSAVRAVLAHGVKEFDLLSNVASGIADNRAPGHPARSKGYTEGEATSILRATFEGSTKALSPPHKRALFWIPWILAYTGLRVSEIAQLQGKRLLHDDSIPYLLITPEDGSTKSGKAWAVGIHAHLVELGLPAMLQAAGPGPVFYEPYPKGTALGSLKGQHRALEAGMRVASWVKGLGFEAPLGRPNHAWRHLFTTRSRSAGMDKEARDFMLGSGPIDAREGYGDWPPAVLDMEINKLPRFAVKDAGRRPY